jgi:hypothetical protein
MWNATGPFGGSCINSGSDRCDRLESRLDPYCGVISGDHDTLTSYYNVLDVNACYDLKNYCINYLPNLFVMFCIFIFLKKRDTPQGCLKVDHNCLGLVVECNLMKNESMCHRYSNYGRCFWNSESCIDIRASFTKCEEAQKTNQSVCEMIQFCLLYFI